MRRRFLMDLRLSQEEETRLILFKRDMHMYPELSHREFRTTERIRSFLAGIEGVEILSLGRELTGAVARITGTKPESEKNTSADSKEIREVGLRADIDAIAQTEAYDSPWKSRHPGVMHACGHDFHTASLLGAALLLSRNREEWSGTVDFLFQEAEETTDGAKEMIDAGLFEIIHPRMFFGLHNRPEEEAGKVVCHKGALMAAKTNFSLTVTGKGGHGGNPHLCNDPIVCAGALIQSLQTIVSRSMDPLHSVVFTIGSIHGGSVENLVVDQVEMTGSIRALEMDAKEKAVSRMEEIVHGVCQAYGCRADIVYREILPPVFNSGEMFELAKAAAEAAVGDENVIDSRPCLASEDFSLFMERVPSFFYWVGSKTPGEECPAWHHASFHADDSGIRTGAELMAHAALLALQ